MLSGPERAEEALSFAEELHAALLGFVACVCQKQFCTSAKQH